VVFKLERLHHPGIMALLIEDGPRRFIVGASEGEEGVSAVRAVVMAGTVLPDTMIVVPLLAIVAEAPVNSLPAFRQHPLQNVVLPDEMVPQSGQGVNSSKDQNPVGTEAMKLADSSRDIFVRLERGWYRKQTKETECIAP
jgi:hypothetical protein